MRITTAILAAVVVIGVTGCSLGDKQAKADRVIAAVHRTEASGVARADLTVSAAVLPTKKALAPGPPRIASGAAANVATVIEFKSSRAAVGIAGDDVAHAAVVFDGTRMFQRTDLKPLPTATAGVAIGIGGGPASNLGLLSAVIGPATPPPAQPAAGTNASATPTGEPRLHRSAKIQRHWTGFDFASLPRNDETRTAGSYAISPAVLVHLASGTLTGSIRVLGPEAVSGVDTTHYRMNVSRDKAFRLLPETARKDLGKIFRANAIGGDVFPAEAWIGADGLLRRFSVRLRQSLSSNDKADLFVFVNLHDFGAAVTIPLPDPKETATVLNLGQLVHSGAGQ